MTQQQLKPYQRHLVQFGKSTPAHDVSILSALRHGLRLGLNFPVALSIALALPFLCNGFPWYHRTVKISSIPEGNMRTQLERAPVTQPSYSLSEILDLFKVDGRTRERSLFAKAVDLGHVTSFWCMTADVKTGLVDASDVRRFQSGDWTGPVVQRRKSRLPGKGDIIPFWRGGPILVGLHSWFVRVLFGVEVYEPR
ncbi:hypothetical protein IAT40_004183 [Kwoniella sp. CBS 6097]